MLWESEADMAPVVWLEYGETSQYYKRDLLIKKEQMGDATLAIDRARFDSQFNFVAYSAIGQIGKDINSREHFLWAAKQKFTALKGDMEITADGKIIMCHDAGFMLDTEGKISVNKYDPDAETSTEIINMAEAECLALQHARYGGYVCSFDEYVRICKKYGKIAWITIRNHYTEEVRKNLVDEMLRILRKYGMVKQSIVAGYPNFAPLQVVRDADPTIMLAWVLASNGTLTKENVDRADSMGNMLICGFHFASDTLDIEGKLGEETIEAIKYAHEKDIRIYEGQIHTMEQVDKLMEYGITGAQIMFNPSF